MALGRSGRFPGFGPTLNSQPFHFLKEFLECSLSRAKLNEFPSEVEPRECGSTVRDVSVSCSRPRLVMKLTLGVFAPRPMKVSLVSSSRPQSPEHTSDATNSSRTSDSSLAPVADFSCPPELSSCLDNSAAKHKLLVKPRNQRSSKMRRLSSVTGSLPRPGARTGGLGDPLPLRSPAAGSRAPSEHLHCHTAGPGVSCSPLSTSVRRPSLE